MMILTYCSKVVKVQSASPLHNLLLLQPLQLSCYPPECHDHAARAARALAHPDTCLRTVLGAPSEWRIASQPAQDSSSSSKASGGSRSTGGGHWRAARRPGSLHRPSLRSAPLPAFQQLQTRFRCAVLPASGSGSLQEQSVPDLLSSGRTLRGA